MPFIIITCISLSLDDRESTPAIFIVHDADYIHYPHKTKETQQGTASSRLIPSDST